MSGWRVTPDVNLYFATTTVVRWRPVFSSPAYCNILIDGLKHCITNKELHLHAYVVMPTHAHYIMSTDEGKNLSNVMRDFNTHTSREITALLLTERKSSTVRTFCEAAMEDDRGNRFKVWQRGFHPIAIESDRFYEEKLDYIHNNPVTAGLVEAPEQWEYSSARNYILGDHSMIQIEFLL
ncbi:MAG: transposase [Bacteroidetes bacterium]|nr:transposase [Bacteroidota bacterium]